MNIQLSHRHPHADGVTPDTQLFQQALDELAQAGGGTLVVDSGRYALGGLRIGSNTRLWLSPGAELIVSENYDDFAQATALSRQSAQTAPFFMPWMRRILRSAAAARFTVAPTAGSPKASMRWAIARRSRRARALFYWRTAVG